MTAMVSDSSPSECGRVTSRERSAGGEVVRGREAEQKIIRDLLRRAQRGAGGVVLVDGEPGIGKSLLLRESTGEAAEQGFSLAAGAADPLGQAIPFFALRAALRAPFAGVALAQDAHSIATAVAGENNLTGDGGGIGVIHGRGRRGGFFFLGFFLAAAAAR